MRVFLTGATGYIGGALARQLVGDGHEIRALVRSQSPSRATEALRQLGVATFAGDIAERASLREGMSGADWVIHAAAELDLAAPPARMAQVNVQGSENVASLAFKLGVPHLLSVSSMAIFGGSPKDGSPATEESPPQLPLPTRYSATKDAGQRAIEAWAERGLAVVTVYPSLVYGPPGKKAGANALLRGLLLGRYPFLVGADRKTSWVFLDDLVDGLVRVIERGVAGRGYLLTGDVATVRDLAGQVAALGGPAPPSLGIPPGLARLLLALAGPVYRLRGRRPPIPPEQAASLARHWCFDDSRARHELGWQPRPLAQGLPPTLDYLRSAA